MRYRGARHVALEPPVDRRARRAKTDMIDAEMLLRTFDGLAKGRTSGLFDGSDPERGRRGSAGAHREREDLTRERRSMVKQDRRHLGDTRRHLRGDRREQIELHAPAWAAIRFFRRDPVR